MTDETRCLRSARWLIATLGTMFVAAAAGAVWSWIHPVPDWPRIGLTAIAILFGAGLIDVVRTRVVLDHDRCRIISGFRPRTIPKSEIENVRWEGGSGVSLKLASGGWAKLPELGRNSQSVANTVRAWLRRSSGPPGGG